MAQPTSGHSQQGPVLVISTTQMSHGVSERSCGMGLQKQQSFGKPGCESLLDERLVSKAMCSGCGGSGMSLIFKEL